MRINNNLMAMNTHRQLGVATNGGAKSMEKLSSGMRINRAGDDAAGLAISEKMRGQIRGLNQASKNSQDGISLIQTAEGALNETHAMLQRMRELAVQASTDTNISADRDKLNAEFQQLIEEIDDISTQTQFNKQNLLDGTFGSQLDATSTALGAAGVSASGIDISGAAAGTYTITDDASDLVISDGTDSITIGGGTMGAGAQTVNIEHFGISITTESGFTATGLDGLTVIVDGTGTVEFQTGANSGENMSLAISDMSASGLAIDTDVLSTKADAQTALDNIEAAINTVSEQRSNLGAKQNRLEHRIKNLDTSSENLQAAESRIRDVDMAKEMMEQTKNNILQQASTAMLAQSFQNPQTVLQLLR